MADDIGSLLLRAGIVASDQVEVARSLVLDQGGTVPEELVRLGFVNDEDLTAFYRSRLLIPRVNPSDLAKLSTSLLAKVPADMAAEFRSIPVAVDQDGNLTLVMSDPSDTKAVDEIGFFTGSYVVRAIATQAQIAWCLAHYYKQETRLYQDLVATGEWPAVKGISNDDDSALASEKSTAPMAVRPARKKKEKKPDSNEQDGNQVDPHTKTGPLKRRAPKRPTHQQPSPPELFARAGEINASDHPARDIDAPPAVVISLGDDESAIVRGIQRGTDTAPILLFDIKQAGKPDSEDDEPGPIILTERHRRSSKHSGVGLASTKLKSELPAGEQDNASSRANSENEEFSDEDVGEFDAYALTPRSTDMVGGQWGEPGTTIPPGFLGAEPSSYNDVAEGIPVAIEEDVTAEVRVADGSVPVIVAPETDATQRSETPAGVKQSNLSDAASKLLLALRAVDSAENRQEVVDALLDFLDLAFERTGFLALRKDELVSWRLHGCPEDTATSLSIIEDSTFRDLIRMRLPFNGPIEDEQAQKLASDLGRDDALDLLALPISIRDRVVGVLFGLGSHGKIYEEHVSVLSQAAAEAFERIVLAQKKQSPY